MRAAVEEARGRVGVVGDAGYGTAIAIEFAKAAERAGADAILLLPPYLLGVKPAGLEAHVDAVCSAIGIGIVIYDRDNAIYSPCRAAQEPYRLQGRARRRGAARWSAPDAR
jgi:5-dehydro-4-deoxyglucarate dehydratase